VIITQGFVLIAAIAFIQNFASQSYAQNVKRLAGHQSKIGLIL
jgi:hypothetical protein